MKVGWSETGPAVLCSATFAGGICPIKLRRERLCGSWSNGLAMQQRMTRRGIHKPGIHKPGIREPDVDDPTEF
ncbi:MAG: hypothetical protein QNJ67_02340 [Kiloniellales bacterium]|nr:hypothetical protein [Kiloniellales bacterium]